MVQLFPVYWPSRPRSWDSCGLLSLALTYLRECHPRPQGLSAGEKELETNFSTRLQHSSVPNRALLGVLRPYEDLLGDLQLHMPWRANFTVGGR